MSMTPDAKKYFNAVADQWDNLRSGYFSEAIRQAAIARAYLRPEMIVADIGAGAGYMSVGLAPLVRQVYVLDGSPAMLEQARGNLLSFDNTIIQQADGSQLPLEDASLDAVFANMYLHHCPDPLAAIQEMQRVLRPGGRIVISDLDAHNHAWMRQEMADEWLGFERSQIQDWFEEAGFVNVLVTNSGEVCSSQVSTATDTPPDLRQANISVFIASATRRVHGASAAVQDHYASIAQGQGCGCNLPDEASSNCCGESTLFISLDSLEEQPVGFQPNYSTQEKSLVPTEAAEMSLGCGNPTAMAELQQGEVVLDIGSGGGVDAFIAAQKVGAGGQVIGVDMTPAMIDRARRSAEKAGLSQVEFRLGHAEALPVEDHSMDVILSNCVINLSEDKGQVFREAYRVLRDNGRLEISDVVSDSPIPAEMLADPRNWGGCVMGALPEPEYLALIAQAGFENILIRKKVLTVQLPGIRAYSITLSARKPQKQLQE